MGSPGDIGDIEGQNPTASPLVLAIDPGREKCGVALAQAGDDGRVRIHHREVVATERLISRLLQLRADYPFEIALIGDGTHHAPLYKALRDALPEGFRCEKVPEAFSSQRARKRFLAESLPSGIARLIPRGLRTPPRPYDDYVATILAEDWLQKRVVSEED